MANDTKQPNETLKEQQEQYRGTLEDFDHEALEREEAILRDLNKKPFPTKLAGYFGLSGPGWLQAALTLGGGSMSASLLSGTLVGYRLLWVQPVAMICGVIMTSAMAHMMTSTKDRPMEAMSRYAHPFLAWGWVLLSFISSIIWCLPQFNLAASVMADWSNVASEGPGLPPNNPVWLIPCFVIVLFTTYITWGYGKSNFWVRLSERVLKIMVALIILAFGLVVFTQWSIIDWGAVGDGFFGFYVPTDDIDHIRIMITAFATAVGINMTFLFPCTIRARGWRQPHRGLAKFDVWTGMLLPYTIATSLVIIASAAMLHGTFPEGQHPGAEHLAEALQPVAGTFLSNIVFGFGILAMVISTIAMLQLVNGLVFVEIFKVRRNSTLFKIGTLTPAVGFLGPLLWGDLKFYIALPTSVICAFFLPVAYIGFFLMMNSKTFLGDARPKGTRRVIWNTAMLVVILIVGAGCFYSGYRELKGRFFPPQTTTQAAPAITNPPVVVDVEEEQVADIASDPSDPSDQPDQPNPVTAAAHNSVYPAPPAPEGMALAWHSDFTDWSPAHWQPTDETAWSMGTDGDRKVYILHKMSEYQPPHRSPHSYSLIRGVTTTGDFEYQVRLKSTGRPGDGHRDLCLFFNYQDPAHYYYVHLGLAGDDHSNQIFIVDDAPRARISTTTTEGTPWDEDYHLVRVVRKMDPPTIEIYWNDEPEPVMTAEDGTFTSGRLGVGSFDNTGMFDAVWVYEEE